MVKKQLDLFDLEPPADVYPAGFLESSLRPPKLERVTIVGLKAFRETEIVLPQLALLTGPNNSGKSTVLQAIALGYECLRRCTDTERWRLVDSGRAVTEFEFLPVNEPRDLWFQRVWKPSRTKELPVEIGLHFADKRSLTFRIRFLFGVLNIRLDDWNGEFDAETLKALLSSAPVLIPATPGPAAHEDYLTLAAVHKALSIREPSRIVRNILRRIQEDKDTSSRRFIDDILSRYFKVKLAEIAFDEKRDLEIRAPIEQDGYHLDIVSSGSGLNQILQLACIIAWRKPSLILLDEPDAHLHSSVQAELFDFLHTISTNYQVQVVLSTHSRDLISQAPLESIVPVDASRSRLEPLKSIDHLLLEFQRYGSLSNVDLALLYQTKSCVFVEGASDAKYLPRIAERCGRSLFAGPRQVIPFEFRGVDKLKFLPDLVRLFERLIGGSLRWAVIRDSDANLPDVKAHYLAEGKKLGACYFHQWSEHSIENYLLNPDILHTAIGTRPKGSDIQLHQVQALLRAAVEDIEDEVSGAFVTRAQLAFRDLKMADNPHDAGATAATKYLRQLDTLDKKIAAYPGRKLVGTFVGRLQKEHGINLRVEDIIATLTPTTVPAEIVECLLALEEKLNASGTE